MQVGGKNIFGILEFLTLNIMLPIGGLFTVIFIGWFYSKDLTKREFTNEGSLKGTLLPTYMFIVKFVAPIAIAMVFLYFVGIFKLS